MKMTRILPMLSYSPSAKKPLELKELPYPLLGFYKYDGWRAFGHPGLGLVTRKLKPFANKEVMKKFEELTWFDGEFIFGDPTASNCYNLTESVLSTVNGSAEGITFWAFDYFQNPHLPYTSRRREMEMSALFRKGNIRYAPYKELSSLTQLLEFEEKAVKLGYEGIMLRRPDGLYKYGRSTLNEGYLIKLKRFEDIEVQILEVYPRQQNNNPKERDERGYSKRSTKKAGKVDLEEVGGFRVKELSGKKREHYMAPGVLTQEERVMLWPKRQRLLKKVAVCRSQPAGADELPRFPRFKGWRSRLDF